jgi:hypothetical protein
MFRLKESSSDQLLNHVWSTSSESVHFWDPKMFITVGECGYKWGWYLQYYIYIKIYPCDHFIFNVCLYPFIFLTFLPHYQVENFSRNTWIYFNIYNIVNINLICTQVFSVGRFLFTVGTTKLKIHSCVQCYTKLLHKTLHLL